ncbi:MAG: hypothetical protein ACK4ME_11635 [Fimbriimonadales bacterium]
MLRVSLAVIAASWIASVWAGSLPQGLARALKQREQFYYHRRIVFHVEERVHVRNRQHQTRYVLEILRTPRALLVRQQPLNGVEMKTEQGNSVRFSLHDGWTSACYIGEEASAVWEPSFLFSTDAQSLEKSSMVANLARGGIDQLYGGALQWDARCRDGCGMYGVFMTGLDVSKIYRTRWERVEERANRWVLMGTAQAQAFEPHLPPENFPNISLRVELRKPDALPMRLEVLVPFRRPNMWVRHIFRTVQTKQIERLEIPVVVQYLQENAEKTREVQVAFKQVLFERLKESVQLDLPQGTTVADERIGSSINYRWQGRLPTEEELKQLAYQQGNLIPPDAPRRRFSPLLLAPAIIFFALAAYLYFRNRRR